MDVSQLQLNDSSNTPIYRQIAHWLTLRIQNGELGLDGRLPATRELAGLLKLNRATISAAYSLLEESGLIEGHVGRGSFAVRRTTTATPASTLEWSSVLPPTQPAEVLPAMGSIRINFGSSRPNGQSFPLSAVRENARQVLDGPEAAEILQLGSSYGYAPLRRYLLDEAGCEGIARPTDDVMITNGCQQALDLVSRVFSGISGGVALEDPSYHGLLRVFSRQNLPIWPVPVTAQGLDLAALEETLVRHRPRLLVVTPSFQNPTGATLPLSSRKRLLKLAESYSVVVVENDIYSQLRYTGEALPSLKQLDGSGNVILLRSYSKVAFPGLRVGWVIAPREVISRLAEEKHTADLHSDQLSQAVLLRFAQSGELARHLQQTCRLGAERLKVVFEACERFLPVRARFTRPEGGMSLWVELPAPLRTDAILERSRRLGVDFLPGRTFSTGTGHHRAFRLCFGGLAPDRIETGLRLIGEAITADLASHEARQFAEPAVALV